MSRKYFIKSQPTDNKIILSPEEYHHIINVMRTKIGDEVIFTDGKGYNYHTKLETLTKEQAVFTINDSFYQTDTDFEVLVCCGLMKGDKNEFIIQKCAELGATKLLFFESEYCIAKAKDNKLDRYNKISIEASKQSGRSTVMEVLPIIKIKQLPQILKNYATVLCAYEKSETNDYSQEVIKNNKIALITGSEGGFSEKEIDFLKESIDNCKIISLGKRILRGETAVVTLTSIVMYLKGELR